MNLLGTWLDFLELIQGESQGDGGSGQLLECWNYRHLQDSESEDASELSIHFRS